MMRREIASSSDRAARLSRVMVLVATLGVAIIATWVLAPALIQIYIAQSTGGVVPARSGAVAEERSAATAAPAVTLAPAPANAATSIDPDAVAQASERAAPPAAVPALGDEQATASMNTAASPWPLDPPTTALAAAAETMPVAAPRPAPDQAPAQGLARAPAEAVAAPLPRSRPSRAIAARLAIPLPRPRPEIADEEPTPDQTAFERDVERMR